MRSLRVFRSLQGASRTSQCLYRPPITSAIPRRTYCSACDTPTAKPHTEATSTKNPPIPPADHRQLASDQELFTTSTYSPGSPLLLPNGARMFNKLTAFLRAQYTHFGFQEVITPTIYKKSLWEKSGHWENYKDDMYSVSGRVPAKEEGESEVAADEEYGLKPMNCPGHCLIFASKQRSYRDLPIRYADFSPLHRNEISGALSGLTRVRRFHQDDGHIFCRPSQIREEISRTLNFVKMTYDVFGLGPYRLALSTRPRDNFIGTVEEWNNAEAALKEALDASKQVWTLNEGDGAFYGPKIDIILRDSDGKEHQTATIQLDFQLPKRFELEYQAPAPEVEQKGLTTDDPKLLEVQGSVTPVLIHRAVLGSVERFMALLIEHYNGRYPFWLNPRQAIILTVNTAEPVRNFAKLVAQGLQGSREVPVHTLGDPAFSIDLDDSPRSLSKKISEAKRKRYGIIIVVGPKDIEHRIVNVDFSGVPDFEALLSRDELLQRNVAMQRWEQAWKEEISQGALTEENVGAKSDGVEQKEREDTPRQAEWLRLAKERKDLPPVSADELRSSRVYFRHLRRLLLEICRKLR